MILNFKILFLLRFGTSNFLVVQAKAAAMINVVVPVPIRSASPTCTAYLYSAINGSFYINSNHLFSSIRFTDNLLSLCIYFNLPIPNYQFHITNHLHLHRHSCTQRRRQHRKLHPIYFTKQLPKGFV